MRASVCARPRVCVSVGKPNGCSCALILSYRSLVRYTLIASHENLNTTIFDKT